MNVTSQTPLVLGDAKIEKLGCVHTYTSSTGQTALIKTLKLVLGSISESALKALESWETDKSIHFSNRAGNSDVVKRLDHTLDSMCPEGVYFGLPNVRSNNWGFWPDLIYDGTPFRNLARSGLDNNVAVTEFGCAVIS